MDFQWPEYVMRANEWLARIATLDIVDAASPECAVGTIAVQTKIVMRMVAPFVPVIMLGLLSCALQPLAYATRHCCQHVTTLRTRLISAALGIFLVSFTVVVETALSAWDCIGEGTG